MKKKYLSGSLTAEAALAFPLFFFAVFALCMVFLAIETKQLVYAGMIDAARDISCIKVVSEELTGSASDEDSIGSVLGYAAETLTLQTALYSIYEKMGCERTGMGELRFPNGLKATDFDSAGSELSEEVMKLKLDYELCIPTLLFGTRYFPITHELKYRRFSGKGEKCTSEGEEEDTDGVYITSTGRVYHTTSSCSALKISVRAVSYAMLRAEKNNAGGSYYPCEKCAKGTAPENVYVTSDGNRYHFRKDCSTLKRDIKKVSRDEVGDREICKRCGGKE